MIEFQIKRLFDAYGLFATNDIALNQLQLARFIGLPPHLIP